MFHDLDFYSSTADALGILDSDSSHYLPRVFMYFDDIIGGGMRACNEFTGERLAIAEFDQKHGARKICKNHYLPLRYPTAYWSHEVFIYHDFEHPRYNDFIAQEHQIAHEKDIRLRSDSRRSCGIRLTLRQRKRGCRPFVAAPVLSESEAMHA
jgi:hypothetical protein